MPLVVSSDNRLLGEYRFEKDIPSPARIDPFPGYTGTSSG